MTSTPVAARDAPAGGFGANSRARTRLYRDGTCLLRDFPVADISEYLTDAGSVVWLDLCRPTVGDFDMIDKEFGLHELAVEDAVGESQRPKLDRYATHLFLSAYAVTLLDDGTPPPTTPGNSVRIGLSPGKGDESPWRWWVPGDPNVSVAPRS